MSKAIDWKDVKDNAPSGGAGGGRRGESPYAELQEGANYFRVVSQKFYGTLMYYAWGRFQKSADEYGSDESICPLGQEKDEKGQFFKARPYYLFKAIERSTGKLKILRVGRQLAQMMKTYATSESWGPLANYDICITKGPKGAQPLYMVAPIPPKPLSEEDKELIANDTIDLEKHAAPTQVKWVQKFIDDHHGARRPPQEKAAAPTPRAPARKPAAEPAPAPQVSNDFSDESGSLDDDFENI